VLVEFALAAVGIVAIAFVTARVARYLNGAMVWRNATFQDSRDEAGRWPFSVVSFGGPPDLHLIGPSAARTPGVMSPPSPLASCPAGQDKLDQAYQRRLEVIYLLTTNRTNQMDLVNIYHEMAHLRVIDANKLVWDAINIEMNINPAIEAIDDRLQDIHTYDETFYMDLDGDSVDEQIRVSVPNIGGINMIDNRLQDLNWQLDPNNEGSVAWQIGATYAALGEVWANCSTTASPVVAGIHPISSCYGQGHPTGIDIDAPLGTRILPFKDGEVIEVVSNRPERCDDCGYGNYVVVRHADGTTTLYAHMNAVYVGVGGQVTAGSSVLGEVGNSGHTIGPTGVHLHFEYRDQYGWYMNPLSVECTPYETMSDAVGTYNPDPGSWSGQCQTDWNNLQTALKNLVKLQQTLQVEAYFLWGLWYGTDGVLAKRAEKQALLQQVDEIVDRWNLGIPSFVQRYLNTLAATADTWGSTEPTYGAELVGMTGGEVNFRLRLLALYKLDEADWGGILPNGNPAPNGINPGDYSHANEIIFQQIVHSQEVRQKLLEAENLEREAKQLCTSGQDP